MYSQNDEERYILQYLGNRPTGQLFDIGANDGQYLSNSLALIERGWSGILVEPDPLTFAKLAERHLDNPKLLLVNAAIGDSGWSLTKFWHSTADNGQPDPHAALSTTDAMHRKIRERQAKYRNPFYMPILPFGPILETIATPIDFLTIDTEGTSMELLSTFFYEDIQRRDRVPLVICVEHDNELEKCQQIAKDFGYREVCVNQENIILVQESLL